MGTLAAAGAWRLNSVKPAIASFEVARVRRGELVKAFETDGELESVSNVDIVCKIPGGSTILWIVPNGAQVEAGDEVARLDSSQIDDRLATQMIAVEEARAAQITAERELAAAAIGVDEYVNGTLVQQRQECEAKLAVARQNLVAAEKTLLSSGRLVRRGFMTPLQRQADEFRVEQAKSALAIARRAKDVLDRYNRPKLLTELESRRGKAQAALRSARARSELEASRCRRLEAQVALCTLRAPQSGMAIYFIDPDRRSSAQNAPQIEEGAFVREHQVILRLPDLERMQAKVVFHESVVDQIHRGAPAKITVQGRELTGQVERVTNQPEPSKRREAHIKKFAAFVRIDGQTQGLRPGETAHVELLLNRRRDVLTAPLAAVIQQGHTFYAWRPSSSEPQRHRVELGAVNEELAEIRSGLVEGDAVVLHPRDVLDEARRDAAIEPIDVARRFGLAATDDAPANQPPPRKVTLKHASAGGE